MMIVMLITKMEWNDNQNDDNDNNDDINNNISDVKRLYNQRRKGDK